MAGSLSISDAEFNAMFASVIRIGRLDNSGDITFNDQIDLLAAANAQQLELFTGGAIVDNNNPFFNSPDVEVARLGMTAVGGIGNGNDIETDVDNLEATTVTGGINIDESDAVIIGGVNGTISGLTVTDNGNISIVADGDITLSDTDDLVIVTGGVNGTNVTLNAVGGASDVTSNVVRDAFSIPNGTLLITAGQNISFGLAGGDNDLNVNGDITLTATDAVTLDGDADVQSTVGNIVITAGDNINVGTDAADTSAIVSFGAGNITLTSGANDFFNNLSGADANAGTRDGVFAVGGGNIVINADRVNNDPASAGITSLGGDVDILQVSAARAIDLGSTTDVAVATLELSEAELQNIVAGGILHIGVLANTGDITVTDQIVIAQADVDTMSLRTSGGIVDGTGTEQTDLTVALLALRASTGIGNVNDLDIASAAVAAQNTTTGNVNITSAAFNVNGLTIGGVDGITQTVNNAAVGQLIITADGGLFVGQDVRAVGNIFLTATDSPAPADNVFLSPVALTVESTAGDVNLRAGDQVVVNGTSNVNAFNNLNITGGLSEIDGGGGVQIIGSISGVVVTVNGGAGDDTFNLDPINAPAAINVFGFQGNDIFNITPNLNSAFIIDGGAPAPLPPGDTLNIDFAGLTNIVFTPGGVGAGTFTFNAGVDALQVDFVSIETLDFFDLGDLPDTTALTGPGDYQTLIGNGGAHHRLGGTLFLGAGVDFDADGQPSADAGEVVAANNGDDNDNDGDDEDGVVFQPAGLVANLPGVVTVTVSQAGFLDAFIDFNSDGDFDDVGEKIADSLPVVAGVQDVGFQVPDVATEELKFTRFRVSSAGGLGANGLAEDGEVEDGQVFVNVVAAGVPEIINGVLIVPGTGLKDNIQFIPKRIAGVDNIRVTIKTQGAAKITQDFPAAGIAGLAAFGLAGNDTIKVNPKINLPATLLGYEGNDKLIGGGGNDLLRGGAGNDTLRGANGNDILLGEADKDSLDGQGGFDISIGGDGVDRVRSTRSQDILIGGTTNYDLNDAALLQLMAQWSNGLSFEQRTANLAANLLANVNDDGDRDVLHSGVALLSRDWFINFANEDKINFKFGSDRLN